MKRWDIINHLIKENGYKSYLEIGYYKGWSFDRVECEQKTAVDPNPCKEQWMEKSDSLWLGEDSNYPDGGIKEIFKGTSDLFFTYYGENDRKWDIIFIDGLHKSEQVDKDIQNALKHLSPGGTIVMHDCNPSSYEMTTTGTSLGEWTGDVYKSAAAIKFSYEDEFYVVDSDYGVGVLKPTWSSDRITSHFFGTWEYFDENRKELLNLISPEEFLKRETKTNETATIDNLSA